MRFSSPRDSGTDRVISAIMPCARALLVAWLIISGLWYGVSTLVTIANFGWPQLAFDQFRIYTSTLGIAFPANVMVPENGHRPIIPALVRIAEIHALGANQYLQIGLGTLFATFAAATIALTVWREQAISAPLRAAGVLFSLVGIFWLGNARMLLHGNEAVGIYLVTLCAVTGALMVRRGAAEDSWYWIFGAATMGVVATFCFAAGVSLFPTFLILAWLLGARWRHILLMLATATVCAALYLFVLSGDGGVRSSLSLRPLESLSVAARWLASPWITGWLGFADPQTHEIVISTPLGLAMKNAANLLQGLLHLQWKNAGALVIGIAGLAIMATGVIAKGFHRGEMTATRTIAMALMMFAAATACLIGIGRLDYMSQFPEQVFADRYLVWGCLFWMGAGLLLLTTADKRGRWLRSGLLIFACLLPIAALPFHQYGAGWGAAIYRLNQEGAAAALSDLFDDRLFQDNGDASLAQRVRSYELLRAGHLGPFRFAGTEEIGKTLPKQALAEQRDLSVAVQMPVVVTDARGGKPGASFEGKVASGVRAIRDRGPLAVIDSEQRIVGYAMFSTVGKQMSPLSLSMPIKRGFDGYVKDYDPAVRYRLVSIDLDGIQGVAWVLADLPAQTP